MDSVTKQYPGSFFKLRHRLKWRGPIVADALEKTFDLKPSIAIIDVGCATGELVLELAKRGYKANGIEGSDWGFKFMDSEVSSRTFNYDIREKINLFGYSLVISFEVAEHIEEKYADVYVDNLCAFGDRILITAAKPGQGGHHHVNCQPNQYWVDKFQDRGFDRKVNKEQIFKEALEPWRRKKELTSYRENCLVFERKK